MLLILITAVLALCSFVLLMYFDVFAENVFSYIHWAGGRSRPYYGLFLGLLAFVVFTTLVMTFTKDKVIIYSWFVKAFVTLILMIPYEMYYGLDAFRYFSRAVYYGGTGLVTEGKSGTANIMYFNHLFTYLVGDSYYSLKLLNSFIAFFGLVFLYKTYKHIVRKSGYDIKGDVFTYLIFVFPSIVFWSSILGKDPINLFFVGMFTYGFVRFMDKKRLRYLVLIAVSIVGVYFVRTWWSVIMIMSMMFYFIRINSSIHLLGYLLVSPLLYVVFAKFLAAQHIGSFQDIFAKMSYTSKVMAYGGSSVESTAITGVFDYIFYFIPNLFTSLYRPMPWDISNPFTLMAAVENVVLFYLTYKYIFKNWRFVLSNKYLRFFLLFIFSWALFYVIISPTNLSVASRFKLQVLPAMLIIIGLSRYMYNEKMDKILKQKSKLNERVSMKGQAKRNALLKHRKQ